MSDFNLTAGKLLPTYTKTSQQQLMTVSAHMLMGIIITNVLIKKIPNTARKCLLPMDTVTEPLLAWTAGSVVIVMPH